jgi:hypothetical protein
MIVGTIGCMANPEEHQEIEPTLWTRLGAGWWSRSVQTTHGRGWNVKGSITEAGRWRHGRMAHCGESSHAFSANWGIQNRRKFQTIVIILMMSKLLPVITLVPGVFLPRLPTEGMPPQHSSMAP